MQSYISQNLPSETVMNLLRGCVRLGQVELFKQLSSSLTLAELDAPHPVTGRTLWHEAVMNDQIHIIQLLKARNVDEKKRDNNGFLAIELALIPGEKVFNLNSNKKKQDEYESFIIAEANRKLREFKNNGVIVYVADIREINDYIEQHPKNTRVGFICKKPNCIKSKVTDGHFSPIYFERNGNQQVFIQIDSANGQHYLIPSSPNTSIQRRHFYAPFHRQATNEGCFEDAVILLMKLLKRAGLVAFCEQHSTALTKEIFIDLSSSECEEHLELIKRQNELKTDEDKQRLAYLHHRYQYANQLALLQYLNMKFSKDEKISKLTSLPSALIPHIEHCDTMRHFRVHETAKVQKVLDVILEQGAKGNLTTSNDDVKKNLSNPDDRYDIRGRNFKERYDFLHKLHRNRPNVKAKFNNFFQQRLLDQDAKNAKSEKKSKLEKDTADVIAKKITGFIFP